MKWLICISIFLNALGSIAQQMRIGVLTAYKIKQLEFSFDKGEYIVFGDTTILDTIQSNEYVSLVVNEDAKLSVTFKGNNLGIYSKVELLQMKENSNMTLTCKVPMVKARKYQDNFELTARNSLIRVVNLVNQSNYLAGVIESEGGGGAHLEYYKVQALMSRTYALQNHDRHAKDGFELCDQVHCQAYHSMLRFTPKIRDAVYSTQGEVLVDNNQYMVTTYFHANCGGQTCDASYIWNNSIPYLESFIDTFCIYTKQAVWTKTIPKTTWRNYLVKEFDYPIKDSILGPMIYSFIQDERKAFYIHPSLGIPLRDLREEFKLKSTFFSTHPEGDNVVIEGRGFGHGVGLCQEGAMKMARMGYSYQQIALFYFTGVRIVNFNEVIYFQQKITLYD